MTNTTYESKDFATFARVFKNQNQEILKNWEDHGDQLHRAVATIIQEAGK